MTLMMNVIWNDAAEPWQLGFQEPATGGLEGIIELHNSIMYYIIIIVTLVSYMLISIIMGFNSGRSGQVHKYHNHGTLIELIWTITPGLILIGIALPSFKLLYLMDEVIDPSITIKAIGHQWYWSYEYSDYGWGDMEYDSYMVDTESLSSGGLRLLEVDNEVVLPVNTHIRFIVTSTDVIHSFAIPSLGIKIDCVPGRLNQTSGIISRSGSYYGQCSELCGVAHYGMPIKIKAVSIDSYLSWVNSKLSE